MADKNLIDQIATWLVIIGGLNWGLAVFSFNLVSFLFDSWAGWLSTVVYALVGLSALYLIYAMFAKK